MKEKITEERYNEIIAMNPEDRIRSTTGDKVADKIIGILIGFSKMYDLRDGWMDIITSRDAEKEIKKLIIECGGSIDGKDFVGIIKKTYANGQPCERNCERHVTHPCERCGRVMAKGEATITEFNMD